MRYKEIFEVGTKPTLSSQFPNGPDPRSSEIDDNTGRLLEIINRDCSDAIAAFRNDHTIWKGIKHLTKDFYKTDPKLVIRKSANTTNFYTMLFDNLSSWQVYPKRSQSLICTTISSRAGAFTGWGDNEGSVYLVLPFNGAKIGVCPTYDMWDAFENGAALDLSDFNDIMRRELGMTNENNYKEFFDQVYEHRLTLASELEWSRLEYVDSPEECMEIFNGYLNPKFNGFNLVTDMNNLPSENREVWTDSESYLVRSESILYNRLYVQ